MLRHNTAYRRTHDMLVAPDIPRTDWGGIQLCHMCQRSIFFAGGIVGLLVKELRWAAMAFTRRRNSAQ